jgi:hypothetical protein
MDFSYSRQFQIRLTVDEMAAQSTSVFWHSKVREPDRLRRGRVTVHLAVTVKWGKEKYENVDLDTAEDPSVFKAQLFALTGVPVDRQKVMSLGSKQLKVRPCEAGSGMSAACTVFSSSISAMRCPAGRWRCHSVLNTL